MSPSRTPSPDPSPPAAPVVPIEEQAQAAQPVSDPANPPELAGLRQAELSFVTPPSSPQLSSSSAAAHPPPLDELSASHNTLPLTPPKREDRHRVAPAPPSLKAARYAQKRKEREALQGSSAAAASAGLAPASSSNAKRARSSNWNLTGDAVAKAKLDLDPESPQAAQIKELTQIITQNPIPRKREEAIRKLFELIHEHADTDEEAISYAAVDALVSTLSQLLGAAQKEGITIQTITVILQQLQDTFQKFPISVETSSPYSSLWDKILDSSLNLDSALSQIALNARLNPNLRNEAIRFLGLISQRHDLFNMVSSFENLVHACTGIFNGPPSDPDRMRDHQLVCICMAQTISQYINTMTLRTIGIRTIDLLTRIYANPQIPLGVRTYAARKLYQLATEAPLRESHKIKLLKMFFQNISTIREMALHREASVQDSAVSILRLLLDSRAVLYSADAAENQRVVTPILNLFKEIYFETRDVEVENRVLTTFVSFISEASDFQEIAIAEFADLIFDLRFDRKVWKTVASTLFNLASQNAPDSLAHQAAIKVYQRVLSRYGTRNVNASLLDPAQFEGELLLRSAWVSLLGDLFRLNQPRAVLEQFRILLDNIERSQVPMTRYQGLIALFSTWNIIESIQDKLPRNEQKHVTSTVMRVIDASSRQGDAYSWAAGMQLLIARAIEGYESARRAAPQLMNMVLGRLLSPNEEEVKWSQNAIHMILKLAPNSFPPELQTRVHEEIWQYLESVLNKERTQYLEIQRTPSTPENAAQLEARRQDLEARMNSQIALLTSLTNQPRAQLIMQNHNQAMQG